VAPPDIDRIGEALGIVGADVEKDRQSGRWVQTGASGVERQFPDRNAHAACALIAETEDALAIADDDGLDLVETPVSQGVPDAIPMRPAQKQSSWIVPIMAESLTPFAHRRRGDERQHFLEVLGKEGVKEGFVGVLQSPQQKVAIEAGGKLAYRLQAARRLHLQCPDMRRQQTVQRKGGAFLLGEGGSLLSSGLVSSAVPSSSVSIQSAAPPVSSWAMHVVPVLSA